MIVLFFLLGSEIQQGGGQSDWLPNEVPPLHASSKFGGWGHWGGRNHEQNRRNRGVYLTRRSGRNSHDDHFHISSNQTTSTTTTIL